jgi:hypothetical protein
MSTDLIKICFDRVKVLIGILSENEISIWYTRVSDMFFTLRAKVDDFDHAIQN